MEWKNSNNLQQSGNSIKSTHYTCGFIYHNDMNNILLIQKKRPSWQNGKINGIGGKVETFDSNSLQGWIREVKEEANIHISSKQKIYNFCRLVGTNYSIEFFCTFFKNPIKFRSETDELIIDIPIQDLPKYNLLHNLPWLIEMSKCVLKEPRIYRVINE